MTAAGQTVCVCMIVKNERHVLARCLQSVLPLIDHWLIVDTGSTDGTQQLALECLQDKPGEVLERPWKNFGHNRSEAIALARGRADYLLTLDADEYFVTEPGFQWPLLTADAYSFSVDSGDVLYSRIQLVRAALPWRYEGVLHEFITCDGPHSLAGIAGIETIRLLEGARSRDPLTYQRDAQVLEQALLEDPNNARHVFYLAQSYRDAHEPALALQHYRQRARMSGFAEEVWCALYEAAKLMENTGEDWTETQDAYLDAYRYRPHRAEPLYRIGMHYQRQAKDGQAAIYLGQAMQISLPTEDVLFIEADVYQFLAPLEYAVACYWLDRHDEAIAVIDRLLADTLSDARREHLLRNRQYSLDALINGVTG